MIRVSRSADPDTARWTSVLYRPRYQKVPKGTKSYQNLNFAGWLERVEAEMRQK